MRTRSQGDSVWVSERIGLWVAAYRCVDQDGVMVVAEVRVFPAEGSGDELGDAAAEGLWSGSGVATPSGGIPARLLRELRPGAAAQHVRKAGEGYRATFNEESSTSADQPMQLPDLTQRQRVARVAAHYVMAVRAGSARPNVEVAQFLGVSEAKVREDLRAARRAGLLSATTRGKPGGSLTEDGDDVLERLFDQRLPAVGDWVRARSESRLIRAGFLVRDRMGSDWVFSAENVEVGAKTHDALNELLLEDIRLGLDEFLLDYCEVRWGKDEDGQPVTEVGWDDNHLGPYA